MKFKDFSVEDIWTFCKDFYFGFGELLTAFLCNGCLQNKTSKTRLSKTPRLSRLELFTKFSCATNIAQFEVDEIGNIPAPTILSYYCPFRFFFVLFFACFIRWQENLLKGINKRLCSGIILTKKEFKYM